MTRCASWPNDVWRPPPIRGDPSGEPQESTAVSELLRGQDLRQTVTTMDALLTQRSLAQQILDQHGDYLMVVKGFALRAQARRVTSPSYGKRLIYCSVSRHGCPVSQAISGSRCRTKGFALEGSARRAWPSRGPHVGVQHLAKPVFGLAGRPASATAHLYSESAEDRQGFGLGALRGDPSGEPSSPKGEPESDLASSARAD